VAISFDSDHETIPLRNRETHPGKLSQGEYGARVAVPRILRLLDHHRVPASFFVPAVSALLHPGEIGTCVAAGHEIALHGWIHEWNATLGPDTERDLLMRSIDVIERIRIGAGVHSRSLAVIWRALRSGRAKSSTIKSGL